jgi:hypothetical protein
MLDDYAPTREQRSRFRSGWRPLIGGHSELIGVAVLKEKLLDSRHEANRVAVDALLEKP